MEDPMKAPKSLIRRGLPALAALAFAAFSGPLFAGAQSRILGRVVDGKGGPVEGVAITVTTPSITTFKMNFTTDKNGKWSTILNDSTLKYHYRFVKKGLITYEEDRKIGIGQTEEFATTLLDEKEAVAKGVIKVTVDPYIAAYNEAVEKYQAGDNDAAVAKAIEATKLGPDKSGGYDLVTKFSHKAKDWDKVIEYGEKALAIEPDNPELFGILSDAYRNKGNKAKQAEYEKKFAAANPDQPDVLYNQAVGLYNKGDFKGAEPLLAKVLTVQADHAKAHFLIGMCYVNLNKISEMKKHLSEYIKLEPGGKDVATAKEMLDAFK
jgi:tetratricopeptide (TPR) repeat protein